jgi:hypothetical protein
LDKPFKSLLAAEKPLLEYKQVNLSSVERHAEVFTPPSEWNGESAVWEGKGFDVVFDLTGDISFDKPELVRRPSPLPVSDSANPPQVQVSNTYQLALSIASSASKLPLKPKAYVRLTYPFYEMKSLPSSSAGHPESAHLLPDGARGRWWHETLRGLARIREGGLNVGVVRCGAWYGRGTWEGDVVPRVVAGHVYQYL